MDALIESLEIGRLCVRWFAMGEAVRLEDTIRVALNDYNEKKIKANKKKVCEAAQSVADFLVRQGTKESREIGSELRNHLDRLKLEGVFK